MDYIDLRSDTVTLPTKQMLESILTSNLGDDVYGDDETTKNLEILAAEILGFECGLLVPTGTFGNNVCVKSHTNHGEEIILPSGCHQIQYEGGSLGLISGVMTQTLEQKPDFMDLGDIYQAIRKGYDIHFPRTSLIAYENPTSSGKVCSLEYMQNVYKIAQENGIKVHLDGARIFNAIAKLEIDPKLIGTICDSITFCLSKGLCAPVGSVVCGNKQFIFKARENRKLLGGGMRQTGTIAGPGIQSLQIQRHLLKEDHQIAQYLAQQLSQIEYIIIDQNNVQINMIFFSIDNSKVQYKTQELDFFMKNNQIKMFIFVPEDPKTTFRIMTHFYIRQTQADKFIDTLKKFFQDKIITKNNPNIQKSRSRSRDRKKENLK